VGVIGETLYSVGSGHHILWPIQRLQLETSLKKWLDQWEARLTPENTQLLPFCPMFYLLDGNLPKSML